MAASGGGDKGAGDICGHPHWRRPSAHEGRHADSRPGYLRSAADPCPLVATGEWIGWIGLEPAVVLAPCPAPETRRGG